MNLKILIFHVYVLNMDISLIIALLKTGMCIAEICMEGWVSQNFDLGLSFCFMPYRKRNFERKYKKNHKSYRFFVIK